MSGVGSDKTDRKPAGIEPACVAAQPADAEDVIALWTRCGLTRPWNDARADFAFALAGPASTVLLLKQGESIVAAAMTGHDGHRGAVYYLGVDPACQRQGLGRRMMDAVEAWLGARGIWKLNLLVRRENSAATGFYGALGYGDQACIALGKRLDGRADRSVR